MIKIKLRRRYELFELQIKNIRYTKAPNMYVSLTNRSKIRRSAHRENAGLFQQGKQQKRDRPRRFGA